MLSITWERMPPECFGADNRKKQKQVIKTHTWTVKTYWINATFSKQYKYTYTVVTGARNVCLTYVP